MHFERLERTIQAFDIRLLSFDQIEHVHVILVIDYHFVLDPQTPCFDKFQLMQPRMFLFDMVILSYRMNGIDKIFLDPFCRAIPLNVFLSVIDMDRTRQTVQADPCPVPHLECETVWRSTDFQDHRIASRTVACSCRDQEMIVFLGRKTIDVFLGIEQDLSPVGRIQILDHLILVDPFLQAQINAGTLLGIQDIVAFVLRIRHSERTVNVLGQRMHLQRQILSSDRIQEVESDRKLCSEAGIYARPEQRFRLVQHQIHGRQLDMPVAEIKIDRVLFRHPVKAPCIVFLVRIQVAHFFHPLAAPDSRIKIRNKAERTMRHLFQACAYSIAFDKLDIFHIVRVQEIIDRIEQGTFMLVGNPPFDKEAALDLPQRIFVIVGIQEVRHSVAVAQRDLPARHIQINKRS